MSDRVDRFVDQLRRFRAPQVFNPWAEHDAAHDASPGAPATRARQLAAYLRARLASARLLLVAEAAGYQGAKFTGCAMTSERILLGGLAARGVLPSDVFDVAPQRTSRTDLRPTGFNEPTATVVWSSLRGAGLHGHAWVNWNAFAFHPHRPGEPLSNRTPTPAEREAARPLLEAFLALFPDRPVVGVGRQAAATLAALGVGCSALRHPSMGGANEFRAGLRRLLRGL